ncbi:MAG: hypothetical protein PHU85_11705 [Phycisphaerae bacterium]|nr:hypothetical protein [Phycisphaerae bacterium]
MADPDQSIPPDPSDPLAILVCATLADGVSSLSGVTFTPAVESLLVALTAVGVRVWVDPASRRIDVTGCGGHVPLDDLWLTIPNTAAMAAMMSLLAVGQGSHVLDGDPAADLSGIAGPLRDLGAWVGFQQAENRPPANIIARGLRGGELFIGESAVPFLPALLAALPYANSDVLVALPPGVTAVGETLDLMARFGVEIVAQPDRLVIPAPQRYAGRAISLAQSLRIS